MNFLSHYYLHNDLNDNHFTVGLTMPDLIGFHSRKIRLTKKKLYKMISVEQEQKVKSLITGMILHLYVDQWFHGSKFFKEKLIFLQNAYKEFNKKQNVFPHFFSHILLEILIDRYLLMIRPNIADQFYNSYKRFDFAKASNVFFKIDHFDQDKFIEFAVGVANSSFLKEYVHDHLIISILSRVSNRLRFPMSFDFDKKSFTDYVRYSYNELEASIKIFIGEAELLGLGKNGLINEKIL